MAERITRKNLSSEIVIDDVLLDDISNLIESNSTESLLNIITDLHPADIGEILNHLNLDNAVFLFHLLDTETASEVILEIDESLKDEILENIDKNKITDIVEELDTDDATDLVADLPDNIAEHVLENIDKEYSEDVKELLKYPEDSAGGIMSSGFISVHESATVKDAIDEIKKNTEEIDHIFHLYVLKTNGELVGAVPIKSLLINPLDTMVSDILEEDLIFVKPDLDQEKVANIMEKYDLVSLPVVDENKIMLGRITFDDIVDVINEEASEDIQKIAGLSEEEEMSYSAVRVSSIRLPWLIVTLIGELLSAFILASFKATIEQIYVAAIFIPTVMALGGSSGTQSATVVVRGLAMGDIWKSDTFRRLRKEFLVAIINGAVCSLILLIATILFLKQSTKFSLILCSSLIIVMISATMIGAIVPLVLKKFKIDPAISTGPFVATANDIIGLLIYFTILSSFYTH